MSSVGGTEVEEYRILTGEDGLARDVLYSYLEGEDLYASISREDEDIESFRTALGNSLRNYMRESGLPETTVHRRQVKDSLVHYIMGRLEEDMKIEEFKSNEEANEYRVHLAPKYDDFKLVTGMLS